MGDGDDGNRRATSVSRLFVFGLGYTAQCLTRRLMAQGWTVAGTVRAEDRAQALRDAGIEAVVFDGAGSGAEVARALDDADHVLVSIAPPEGGDPVLGHHRADIAARAGALKWIGYLSTVGVYGDYGGAGSTRTRPASGQRARAAAGHRGGGMAALRRGVRRSGRDIPHRRHLRAGAQSAGLAEARQGAAHRQAGVRSSTASMSTTSRVSLEASIRQPEGAHLQRRGRPSRAAPGRGRLRRRSDGRGAAARGGVRRCGDDRHGAQLLR
jgi:hypothetical protein